MGRIGDEWMNGFDWKNGTHEMTHDLWFSFHACDVGRWESDPTRIRLRWLD